MAEKIEFTPAPAVAGQEATATAQLVNTDGGMRYVYYELGQPIPGEHQRARVALVAYDTDAEKVAWVRVYWTFDSADIAWSKLTALVEKGVA